MAAEVPGRQTGYAEVNGAQLYYEVAGEGPPVVLLHAGVADGRMWDEQFPAFAERHRVLRYDMRGFGRSALPPGPYAMRDDLHGLLRHVGIERAALVGLSMGGSTAIDFTLEHPEMVTALVAVAAGVSGNTPSDELIRAWEEIEAALERGETEQALELELRMWVDGPRRTPEQVDPTVRERVRVMNGEAMAQAASAPEDAKPRRLDPPAIGRLGEIRAPTLVIVGDADVPHVVGVADLLATEIAGARKVVIPGVAHMVNMERPQEFNRLVLEFLAGV